MRESTFLLPIVFFAKNITFRNHRTESNKLLANADIVVCFLFL